MISIKYLRNTFGQRFSILDEKYWFHCSRLKLKQSIFEKLPSNGNRQPDLRVNDLYLTFTFLHLSIPLVQE